MQRAINRFIFRMNIRNHYKIKIISCLENQNQKLLDKFNELRNNKPILELYHGVISGCKLDIKSICDNGFIMGHGNKGQGTYLANHSRYCGFWATNSPAIICHVIANEEYVKRFRSEIRSPSQVFNSEFTVNPVAIYPRYILDYKLIRDKPSYLLEDLNNRRLIVPGNYGCEICDKYLRKCNCEQYPSILETDIINDCFENYNKFTDFDH